MKPQVKSVQSDARNLREWETLFMVNVEYLIRKSKLTLESISGRSGIPRQTLQRWSVQKCNPGIESVLKFCDFFNVTAEEIFTKDLRPIRKHSFGFKLLMGNIKNSSESLPDQKKNKGPKFESNQLGLFDHLEIV